MAVAAVITLYATAIGVGVFVGVGQRVPPPSRRSLAEIRRRAIRELCVNDTISVYTMFDDYEWRREYSYPAIRMAVNRTIDQIALLALGVEDFSRQLDEGWWVPS